MSWYYSYRPYVSAAERRRKAEAAIKRLAAKGGAALAPVSISGRAITTTFWGKAWCDNLEAYSDYSNRLPRGRTYARNGSIIDLQIGAGEVKALVQGSDLYKVTIGFSPLSPKHWREFQKRCAGKITSILDLLQGRLSKEILADITAQGTGLFPAPHEINLDCSCPDWAGMCKHVAAVLYCVGARLDQKPDLFFTLRGVDMQDLITAASATATAPFAEAGQPEAAFAGVDLGEIFGVEIESADQTPKALPAASEVKKAKAAATAKGTKAAKEVKTATGKRPKTAAKAADRRSVSSVAAKKPATKKNSKPVAVRPQRAKRAAKG